MLESSIFLFRFISHLKNGGEPVYWTWLGVQARGGGRDSLGFQKNSVILFSRDFEEMYYLFKQSCILCVFVLISDHNSWIPWSTCLKFWLGNSGEPWECSKLGFEILTLGSQAN